jgi:hypothetical protein
MDLATSRLEAQMELAVPHAVFVWGVEDSNVDHMSDLHSNAVDAQV